ncbi:site-2 protease family protein [Leptolyngbya sp. FACHB-261]|uniref:site-2 protease family protein n=1 Tax=Leptolyngbya sp. FACHB-261 TaxID=2692806 RepID=UPI001682DA7A|nr:site-2 protease family protein [Leptolyngbya sp. FACHB-261]MBD2102727.1 site-2 protease family protein [Leptolyngbya sp. FACHB-261]
MASASSFQVGSLLGIPLRVDYSWFAILGLLTFSYGIEFSGRYPGWGPALAWGTGLVAALMLFASVLLHELGHSLVARSQGLGVDSITLFLFGGIASIDKESPNPAAAFWVAAAGPCVSIGLGLFGWVLGQQLPTGTPAWEVIDNLWHINLVLALFNLIPGLPLDGGQILKAAVWQLTGNRFTGIRWAARTGKLLGLAAIALGVAGSLFGSLSGGLWIAFIGWFIFNNASAYSRLSEVQQSLSQITASESMSREFRVLDANLSLRRFADEYLLGNRPMPIYFITADGRYKGFVTANDLQPVERSLWDSETLRYILHPMSELITIAPIAPLCAVIDTLETQGLPYLVVLAPTGAVEGLIDRGDVVRILSQKLNWSFSEADIHRIKEEGSFPANLRLQELSKGL